MIKSRSINVYFILTFYFPFYNKSSAINMTKIKPLNRYITDLVMHIYTMIEQKSPKIQSINHQILYKLIKGSFII